MQSTGTWYGAGAGGGVPARLVLSAESLTILPDSGESVHWPRTGIRVSEGAVAGSPARLEHGGWPGTLLLVADRGLLAALGHHRAVGAHSVWTALAVVTLGTTALLAAAYLWGLPWIAGALARQVPASVEAELGKVVVEQLAPRPLRCDDPAVRAPILRVMEVLERAAPGSGPFHLFVVRDPMVNAFAAPGGYVVVYTGLLEKTRRPEELAAVLAHEITHVTERHGTQALMRSMAFWTLLSYIAGDMGGILVQSAGALNELSYRRGQEEAADRGAMRLFEEAGADPQAMVAVFEMLSRQEDGLPSMARYLSTHPRIEDRLRTIRKWAAESRYRTRRLLPGELWPPRVIACSGA